jgi:photosystem II stability/assembly factor-like uncharacterized protein
MGAVWRRPLVSLALLCALLAGCSHHSTGRANPPTSRTGGSEGPTSSTAPGPPSTLVAAAFAGEHDGWALTQDPCPQPTFPDAHCAVVWKTTDGGGSWARLGRLDVPGQFELGPDFVSAVHFADTQHGWVYSRSLFATFNGGKRWQRVDLGNPVVALDSTSSQMFALVAACGDGAGNCPNPMRVFEGTVATGRWRFVNLGFELPSTDKGTIIVSRGTTYALVSDYSSGQAFLARATAGRWERRTVPCPRAAIAAIQGEDGLVAACRPPASGGATELQTSSDGGRSWAVVWQHSFPGTLTSLAVTGAAAVVSLDNGDVLRTTDNGMHFAAVLHGGANPALQFSDDQHGIVTAGPAAGRQLFSTMDGGGSWKAVPPPR